MVALPAVGRKLPDERHYFPKGYGRARIGDRAERQADAMTERHLIDPTPGLADDTPIDRVRFPTRIHNVLATAGLKTVGEVREISDETLLSFQDRGKSNVTHLRETLGRPSTNGIGPR